MRLEGVVANHFVIGIVNFRKFCSVAHAFQERCFSSVRSADDENSESANAIKVLFEYCSIQMSPFFDVYTSLLIHISQCNRNHYSPVLFEGPAEKNLRIEMGAILAQMGLLSNCTMEKMCVD